VADEALTAGAVARLLGVAVTTLRTWHQRYGLGPGEHVPGQHRRYTAEDLARLEVMRRLTVSGVPPAEAAHWARRMPTLPTTVPPPVPDDEAGDSPAMPGGPPEPGDASLPGLLASGDPLVPGGPPVPGDVSVAGLARDGGGHALPVGRAGPVVRGLARAAMRLDATALREIIAQVVAEFGVAHAWDSVLRPLLVSVGDGHASTDELVEVEHLVSRCVSEVLGAVPRPGSGGPPARILLACADEEQHSLPLEALAAALAEAGVGCRQLGARVPAAALARAVARTGPAAIVLWAQAPATADPAQLRALLTGAYRPLLVAVGGPGWQPAQLPAEVVMLTSLDDAIRITMATAKPVNPPSGA
jgi:hypothetical protein